MNYAYQQNQKQNIIGAMQGLMRELQQLAPHPDQPSNNGPIFIQATADMKVANDHDGMLGSMLMEAIIGGGFSEAVSETCGDAVGAIATQIDFGHVMDAYSEYISDVAKKSQQEIAAHGQGTLASMSGTSISGGFNMRATISDGMQAFFEDLPKRMDIERSLAYYARQLQTLDRAPQQNYDAPKPRFAA